MKHVTYIGTRDASIQASASEAILKGICADGGLYIPAEIPTMDTPLEELAKLSYQDLAFTVLRKFVDFTDEELRACIDGAYDEKFDTKEIAPLVQKGDAYFLELFHGRTLAFKDMALSILPYLMKTAAKREGIDKEIVILTATSGDTGKAALEGFADVEGTKIIVFFPEDGVSPVQKLQMTTQEGKNTCVVGILGNFDDAQTAVKQIFTDVELAAELEARGYVFSSANSINIGRLVPQIVYYFHAYLQAVKQGGLSMGESINFSVPTGNFGDILAGWYAMKMGLPVGHFVCASNDNKVLYDFFQTGTYDRNREFHVTVSPSMDILISSNLERLISHMVGQDLTKEEMTRLQTEGKYSVEIKESKITGEYATEAETYTAIKDFFGKTGYVMDTHTAVGYAAYKKYKEATGDNTPTVIVSTASPYKFTKDVMMAMDDKYKTEDAFVLMDELAKISGVAIPEPIRGIETREILHKNVCEKTKIQEFVKGYLL
ncbi:threonine synthase [Chakrabartyella piscis]|uniref:threonine synthase n=1 Tax=Chakrabartyella piscis TaxID=2918914 RepID=UPI002958589D|nr:threonine synthase [Chakrabartyella piscis]